MRQAPYAQARPLTPCSRASSGWEPGGSGNRTKGSTQNRDFEAAELETVGPGPGTQQICITGRYLVSAHLPPSPLPWAANVSITSGDR